MSSRRLEDLVPDFQPLARRVLERAGVECGPAVSVIVTCTLRSRDEQAALYARGRTEPGLYLHRVGRIPSGECASCAAGALGHAVTQGAPGSTYHEYGRAFDVLLLRSGKPIQDIRDPAWQAFGRIVQEEDLCWGGAWRIKDGPHVELHPPGLGCRDAARLARPRTESA